jgi:hypothetical protein
MCIGRHDTKPSQVANTYFDVKALIGEIDAQAFQVSDTTLLGGIPVTHQLKYNQLPNEYSLQLRFLLFKKVKKINYNRCKFVLFPVTLQRK